MSDQEPVARFDLDAISQAIEERDQAIHDTELLAQRMVYHGNSVSWWYSKAMAYRNAIDEAWKALKARGVLADGETTVAQAIATLAPPSESTTREPVAKNFATQLKVFAKIMERESAIRASERERCAKVCEEFGYGADQAMACAAAIRELGNE